MNWKDILRKFKLVDVNAKVEADQLGVMNVQIENNNFTFNFPDAESVKMFMAAPKTPELEAAIREEVLRRLTRITPNPELLTGTTRFEVTAATTATSSLDVVQLKKL